MVLNALAKYQQFRLESLVRLPSRGEHLNKGLRDGMFGIGLKNVDLFILLFGPLAERCVEQALFNREM